MRRDGGEKVVAEAGPLTLVPEGGLGDVHLRLKPGDNAVRHCRSFACTRAFTSSHGLPASGDRS